MADKRISQLVERTDIANNDVLPIVASGATTTNKVTISTIQDWMQDNLDVGVTSVGLSMPSAFTVTNSPVTTSGNISVVGAGTVSQYIRGDGSLADFPQGGGGGGASVNYYLNGSVSQGTIGGIAYTELSKVPILGTGTDFTINADGYIASFITDAGDPSLLQIPGGNWNFETYFQASSGGGTPTFYVELYKVDSGGTATLIASSSGSPELIAFGTNITPYFSSLAVPTTTLALTDRLAIRYYVAHSGRTITLHTENNTLCQIITTFTTGLTALNGLTAQVQNFATGTSGTDFAISSATSTHTFNLPTASASNRGALSSADWTTFNNKTSNLGTVTSVGLSSATSGVFIGTTPITTSGSLSFTIATASGSQNGLLSSTDWTTFNGKQAAGNYVTLDTAQTITALKTFSTSVVEMAIFNSTFSTGGVLAFSRNGANVGNIGNSGSLTVGVLDDFEIRSGSAKKIHLRTDATQFTLSPSGGATLFSADSSTPLLILNTTGTNQPSGIGTQQNGANKWAFGTNFGSSDDSWNVYNYTAASRFLTIASTGAATFSNVVGINRTPTSGYKLDIQGNEGIRIIDNDVLRSIIITPPNSGASGTISTASGQGISFQSTNASGNLKFETAGVERIRVTTDGLTFNGDTAAANALDDYEEGTWTMGIAFGGNSVGVTYGNNSGRYTKVGRQVTVIGYMSLTSKGSSTGLVAITGLPFTIGSTNSNYSAPALYMSRVSFSGQFHSYGDVNGTTIAIRQVSEAGVPSGITNNNCGNDSDFIVSFTYFV